MLGGVVPLLDIIVGNAGRCSTTTRYCCKALNVTIGHAGDVVLSPDIYRARWKV